MPTLPGLEQLTRSLTEPTAEPLEAAAAWDILDLACRLADSVAAHDTTADTVAALAAAQAASAARDLLPLPDGGTPQPDPTAAPESAGELALALDLVRDRLDQAGRQAGEPDTVYALHAAADHAGAAAAGLRSLWIA